MSAVTAFVFDRRYSVPTLLLEVPATEGAEREAAERLLHQSEHYMAVELRRDEALLCRIERDRTSAEEAARSSGRAAGA